MSIVLGKSKKLGPVLVDGSKEGNPAHLFTINDKIHWVVHLSHEYIHLSSRSPEIQGIQLDNYIINCFISTSGRCWRVFNPIAKTTRFLRIFKVYHFDKWLTFMQKQESY